MPPKLRMYNGAMYMHIATFGRSLDILRALLIKQQEPTRKSAQLQAYTEVCFAAPASVHQTPVKSP